MTIVLTARAMVAIVSRDVKHYLHTPSRLLSAIIRPMLWLLLLGSGMSSVFSVSHTISYQTYIYPGLLGLTLLFGCVLAALSMVHDKESGIMRALLLAPISYYLVLQSRILSAILIGLVQVYVLMLILSPLGYGVSWENWGMLIGILFITAWLCSSVGMMIAVLSNTTESYTVVLNFIILPIFFLSGALYPLAHLSKTMLMMVHLNPFSYAVDALQQACGLIKISHHPLGLDITVVISLSIILTLTSSFLFARYKAEKVLTHY